MLDNMTNVRILQARALGKLLDQRKKLAKLDYLASED